MRSVIVGSLVIGAIFYVIGGAWPVRSETTRGTHLGQTGAMGSTGDKPRKPRRRLPKVPKYEEPNTFPAAGLTGGGGGVYGSRYGHSADHQRAQAAAGRFGAFVLRRPGAEAQVLSVPADEGSQPARVPARFAARRLSHAASRPRRRGATKARHADGQHHDDHREPHPRARDPLHAGGPGDRPARRRRQPPLAGPDHPGVAGVDVLLRRHLLARPGRERRAQPRPRACGSS